MLSKILLISLYAIELDSNYPGIIFFNKPVSGHLTPLTTTIGQLETFGISVSLPQNSLSSEEEYSDMHIHPCFTGPFELATRWLRTSKSSLSHLPQQDAFPEGLSPSGCITMPTYRVKRIVLTWHSSQPVPPQSTGGYVQCTLSKKYMEPKAYSNLETR